MRDQFMLAADIGEAIIKQTARQSNNWQNDLKNAPGYIFLGGGPSMGSVYRFSAAKILEAEGGLAHAQDLEVGYPGAFSSAHGHASFS